MSDPIICPFCKAAVPELLDLKLHMIAGQCDAFNKLDSEDAQYHAPFATHGCPPDLGAF